jgi:hypothetical protein
MPLFNDFCLDLRSRGKYFYRDTAALATYFIPSSYVTRRAQRRADLANEISRAVASGTTPARIHLSPSSLLQVASAPEYSEELARAQTRPSRRRRSRAQRS